MYALLDLIEKFIYNYTVYPEKYLTTAKYQFMLEIDNGDKESIERYRDTYIAKDMYLYNGPFTIKECCNKYELDYSEVYDDFKNSDYTTFQQYFNREIKK